MGEDRDTIVHEWFDQVWNHGDESAIDRLFAADGVAHGLEGVTMRGPAEFKPFYHQFRQAFPDITVEVVDSVVEGDKIAARCLVRGTHTGPCNGLEGSGCNIEFTGMVIVHVRNGQILESWNNFDFSTLNAQLAAGQGGS